MKTEAEIRAVLPQAKEHQAGRGKASFLPRAIRGNIDVPPPWFQTSSLQNHARMKFSCAKPANLYGFVRAAQGDYCSHLRDILKYTLSSILEWVQCNLPHRIIGGLLEIVCVRVFSMTLFVLNSILKPRSAISCTGWNCSLGGGNTNFYGAIQKCKWHLWAVGFPSWKRFKQSLWHPECWGCVLVRECISVQVTENQPQWLNK